MKSSSGTRLRCHGRAAHCLRDHASRRCHCGWPGSAPSVPTGERARHRLTALRRGWLGRGAAAASGPTPRVRVITDVLDLDISLQGGDLVARRCLTHKYPPRQEAGGSPPVRLSGRREAGISQRHSHGLARAQRARGADAPATYTSAADELPPGARRGRTARTDHVDGRAGRHGHQDLRVQAGPLRHRGRVRRRQPVGRAVVGRFVCAGSPGTSTRRSLDVRRRELRPYRGPAIYDGTVPHSNHRQGRGKFAQNVTNGWIATMQHHFRERGRAARGRGLPLHPRPGRRPRVAHLSRPAKAVPGRHTGRFTETVRRSEAAGAARGPWARASSSRRLRQAHHPVAAAVLAAREVYGFVGNWGWGSSSSRSWLKLLFSSSPRPAAARMAKMRTIAPRHQGHPGAYKDTASSSPSR